MATPPDLPHYVAPGSNTVAGVKSWMDQTQPSYTATTSEWADAGSLPDPPPTLSDASRRHSFANPNDTITKHSKSKARPSLSSIRETQPYLMSYPSMPELSLAGPSFEPNGMGKTGWSSSGSNSSQHRTETSEDLEQEPVSPDTPNPESTKTPKASSVPSVGGDPPILNLDPGPRSSQKLGVAGSNGRSLPVVGVNV
jgi:hypothetical protein